LLIAAWASELHRDDLDVEAPPEPDKDQLGFSKQFAATDHGPRLISSFRDKILLALLFLAFKRALSVHPGLRPIGHRRATTAELFLMLQPVTLCANRLRPGLARAICSPTNKAGSRFPSQRYDLLLAYCGDIRQVQKPEVPDAALKNGTGYEALVFAIFLPLTLKPNCGVKATGGLFWCCAPATLIITGGSRHGLGRRLWRSGAAGRQ